jgi:hypothetical protein
LVIFCYNAVRYLVLSDLLQLGAANQPQVARKEDESQEEEALCRALRTAAFTCK